jgi:hypothetical protein
MENSGMNRILILSAACALGLSACATRAPSDAQLIQLLRRDGAAATDANAPLDAAAVSCLRVWSDDAELAKDLPTGARGDDAKNKCRLRLDGWLADATRNPEKFAFKEVSAPPVVRRAVALLAAHAPAATSDPGEPPAALTNALRAPEPVRGGPVDQFGSAGFDLKRAEDLCQQAQQLAAAQGPESSLRRFANYCGRSLRQLRASMKTFSNRGGNLEEMDRLGGEARKLADVAEQALAEAQQK